MGPNETFFCVSGVPYAKANQYKGGAAGLNIMKSKMIVFSVVLLLLSCFAAAKEHRAVFDEVVLYKRDA